MKDVLVLSSIEFSVNKKEINIEQKLKRRTKSKEFYLLVIDAINLNKYAKKLRKISFSNIILLDYTKEAEKNLTEFSNSNIYITRNINDDMFVPTQFGDYQFINYTIWSDTLISNFCAKELEQNGFFLSNEQIEKCVLFMKDFKELNIFFAEDLNSELIELVKNKEYNIMVLPQTSNMKVLTYMNKIVDKIKIISSSNTNKLAFLASKKIFVETELLITSTEKKQWDYDLNKNTVVNIITSRKNKDVFNEQLKRVRNFSNSVRIIERPEQNDLEIIEIIGCFMNNDNYPSTMPIINDYYSKSKTITLLEKERKELRKVRSTGEKSLNSLLNYYQKVLEEDENNDY